LPSLACLQAIFPGILGHGYGHLYAGDKLTGNILIASEVCSFWIFLTAFGQGWDNPNFITAQYLFWIPWLYDVIHSPFAASAYNKYIEKKYNISINVKIISEDKRVFITMKYIF